MSEYKRLTDILNDTINHESPKVTIALPTHRRAPENLQDKILFKNLIQKAQKVLDKYPRRSWEPLMQHMLQLLDNTDFWLHTSEGLVVLGCEDRMEAFRLDYPVEKGFGIGKHFFIEPLFELHETFDNPYLIDISKDRAEIYHISESSVDKIEEHEIKTSLSDIYDDFDIDANLNVGTYSGLTGMRHGHRAKPEEVKKDREKYFRYLDKKFEEIYKSSSKRFILAGTAENIAAFKKISQSKAYYDETIEHPLFSLSESELLEKAREILKPAFEKTLAQLELNMRRAEHSSKLLTSYDRIGQAALQGKINMIIYNRKKGSMDEETARLMNLAVASGAQAIVTDNTLLHNSGMAAILD